MDNFASETDSDYTSYWRDWVSAELLFLFCFSCLVLILWSFLRYMGLVGPFLCLLLYFSPRAHRQNRKSSLFSHPPGMSLPREQT